MKAQVLTLPFDNEFVPNDLMKVFTAVPGAYKPVARPWKPSARMGGPGVGKGGRPNPSAGRLLERERCGDADVVMAVNRRNLNARREPLVIKPHRDLGDRQLHHVEHRGVHPVDRQRHGATMAWSRPKVGAANERGVDKNHGTGKGLRGLDRRRNLRGTGDQLHWGD